MNLIEKLVLFFMPKWELYGTPYFSIWSEKEKNELQNACSITFVVAAIGYILHYFLLDIQLIDQNDSFWITYRFSLAGAAVILSLLSKRISSALLLNLTLLGYGLVATYFQTYSMTKSELVPYIWSFIIPSVICTISSIQIPGAIAYCIASFLVSWPIMLKLNIDLEILYGAGIFSIGVLIIFKKSMKDKVTNFLTQQELLKVEKALVESQKELTNSILKIFPQKHKNILINMVTERGWSPVRAMDELLQPQEKNISCIFTDIRGYTQASKNIDFISGSIVPSINSITKLLENHDGIPSFVGDLIFTYFDDDLPQKNILNAIDAATEILDFQTRYNKTINKDSIIQRYLILDCGNAIVGNIGGIDSSIEITALGTPANLTARIDEVTKNKEVRKQLGDVAVVMTPNFAKQLTEMSGPANIPKIKLDQLNLTVKDFPEIDTLYYFNQNDLSDSDLKEAA